MIKIKSRNLLEKLHKLLFRFDAEVQVFGWSWVYWYNVHPEVCPEGGYIIVTDGWLCFQRRYAV